MQRFGQAPIEQVRQLGQIIGNQTMVRLLAQRVNPIGNQPSVHEEEADAAREKVRGDMWDLSKDAAVLAAHRTDQPEARSLLTAPSVPGNGSAKLTIGHLGDRLEHEADRVAERVMRMPAPTVSSAAAPRQASRNYTASDENGGLQKEPTGPQVAAGEAPGTVPEVLRTSGQPLDAATRAFFEPRFGYDFSRVRVLSDSAAKQSARDVNAHAYTVGHKIVFDACRFAPGTHEGRRLIAHELAHVVKQSGLGGRSVGSGALQRTPAAPGTGGAKVPFDRGKVDIAAIPDVLLVGEVHQLMAIARLASVQFVDPAIQHYNTTLYDPADRVLSTSANSPIPGHRAAVFSLFGSPIAGLTQGRYTLRCIGYDGSNRPIAYADRSFFVWTSTPTGKPPDIAALETEKAALEATTRAGSGKTFDEVAIAFTKLEDVKQRLGILETGTGSFVGSECPIHPPGTESISCTSIVMTVLEKVFTQQGRAADWAKVQKKIAEHTKTRSKKLGLEGEDIQAALQSEVGWKGIFWAPDPAYKIPTEELTGGGITEDEAGWAFDRARKKGIYGNKGEPKISIDHLVTNYAPEAPKVGHGEPSKTKKDTTQLAKLKKLPFGVLAAHGATHMTLITYGKVIEVHWEKEATDVHLIEQTDLEKWAVGPKSGYHYFASGTIVAPAADVDAAFK
jgi:hypothetical protein